MFMQVPAPGRPIASEVRLPESEREGLPQREDVPLKVLIVDDNADLAEMLAMVVEGAGHAVRKAQDGRSAISAALSYSPQVVFLDLGLPDISGLDIARELRRHPETASARLVALTGWGQAEDRRLTQEAGFDHHMTKPTEPQSLKQLLSEIASRRES
jgi:DNA-binding response OmpR family regulator